MCGIYGMVSLGKATLRAPELLAAMGRSIHHRGPDSSGVFQSPRAGMGCERLRVVDLRRRADQPFSSPEQRYQLVCNGEIYNAAELRQRFSHYPFRSASDVETILPLYLDEGPAGLCKLDGMFGLAIWEASSRTLILARDRAGEKPLFYSRVRGELWFASEVQALLLNPAVSRELDETAISQYLALGYVPEPRTAFRDIRKIESGMVGRFTEHGQSLTRYWNPSDFEPSTEPAKLAIPRLRQLLQAAVRKQLVADVPVGIFLSGGIDSALVAAIAAQDQPGLATHTFTARFTDASYDEGATAAAAADLVGTRHHEVIIDEQALTEAYRAVTDTLAEPLAAPAILPTYHLAKTAKEHVSVVLSGEGADELFGGYPTYLGHSLMPWVQSLPAAVLSSLRTAAGLLPSSQGKVTMEFLLKRFLADAEQPLMERHLAWFGTGAEHTLATLSNGSAMSDLRSVRSVPECLNGVMRWDYRTYLPDCLLVKNDRATMMSSLEARAPFLDRDLSAFAFALPACHKVRRLTTKWMLKEAATQWLPRKALLCCLILISTSAFESFRRGDGSGRWAGIVFWAAAALAVLAKGPVGLMLPLAIALVTLICDGQLARWRSFAPIAGPLTFVTIAGSWAAAADLWVADYSVWGAFQEHFAGRAIHGMHHEQPVWYYLKVLPYALLPWSFLLPGALLLAWRRRHNADDRFLLVASLSVVLFFTISTEKRDLYILPAVPMFALLIARLVASVTGWWRVGETGRHELGPKWVIVPLGLVGGLMVLAALAVPFAAPKFGDALIAPAATLAAVLSVGGFSTLWLTFRGSPLQSTLCLGGTMAAAMLVAVSFVYPPLNPVKSGRELATIVRDTTATSRASGRPVLALELENVPRAVNFYSNGLYLQDVTADQLIAELSTDGVTYLLANKAALPQLSDELEQRKRILYSTRLSRKNLLLLRFGE